MGYLAQDSDDESGKNKQTTSAYDKTENKKTTPKATATEYPANTDAKPIAPAARKLNRTSRNHKIIVEDTIKDATAAPNNSEEPVTPKVRSLHLKSRDKPILVEPIKSQFGSTTPRSADDFSPTKGT